jgi:hypothetical protein
MSGFYTTIAKQFSNTKVYVDAKPLPPLATQTMLMFSRSLPDKMETPLVDDELLATDGWLCPGGKLYACRWRQHNSILESMNVLTEAEMEMKGWKKLTQMKWLIRGRFGNIELTDKQVTTIAKWHSKNELDTSHYDYFK